MRAWWRRWALIAVLGIAVIAAGSALALASGADRSNADRSQGQHGSAARARRPPLSIGASPSPATAGGQVVVRGVLRARSSGRRIALWQETVGGRRFERVATVTTRRFGRYTITRRRGSVDHNLRWYVTSGSLHSRTVSVRVHAGLTLSASPGSLAPGGQVKLVAHVTPRHAHTRVTLQERSGSSRWTTIARLRLDRHSSFTQRRRLTGLGAKQFRFSLRASRVNIASRSAPATVTVGALSAGAGIQKIQHVIMIMQENRSFDNYFGTYPGADGIPPGVCVKDPGSGGCVAPFYDSSDLNYGGPHNSIDSTADIDGGKMDGFIGQAEKGEQGCTGTNPSCGSCRVGEAGTCDVMGYHDARNIPNYWRYAQDFVLQDQMFASSASWSLPEHLYNVSEWAATCSDPNQASSCVNDVAQAKNQTQGHALDQTPLFAWTDLTYLLHAHNVSWGYYVYTGQEPDCPNGAMTCNPGHLGVTTPGIWNPLPHFTDVHEDNQLGNIQTISNFYTAAKAGTLPAVSWVIPNQSVSEHPPALISTGQAYVTNLINTVMQGPDWNSTAIFLSWDDWGGFYDNVPAAVVDQDGYGIRVPGLVISPYAKQGYIDHQLLSHDAYTKFIEDDFLGGARLDPATDGRPDPRPDVRESNPALGDLASEFDFTQAPRPAVILPTNPSPGPASTPP